MMSFKELVLATHNRGKLAEFQEVFKQWQIELIFDPSLEEPVEDGLSFIENALIKARAASKATGLAAMADDSGIIVPALNNQPGLYSARYAKLHNSELDNHLFLLQQMQGIKQRQAYFYICLAIVRDHLDPAPIVVTGRVDGLITEQPIGEQGHGYDPVFFYPPYNKTFAQLTMAEKNQVSHRAQALQKLATLLK